MVRVVGSGGVVVIPQVKEGREKPERGSRRRVFYFRWAVGIEECRERTRRRRQHSANNRRPEIQQRSALTFDDLLPAYFCEQRKDLFVLLCLSFWCV